MFQQAPMSPIFDVRCVHRPNSNDNTTWNFGNYTSGNPNSNPNLVKR